MQVRLIWRSCTQIILKNQFERKIKHELDFERIKHEPKRIIKHILDSKEELNMNLILLEEESKCKHDFENYINNSFKII